jgi:hypothetical protein
MRTILVASLFVLIGLVGCTIVTEEPAEPILRPATSVVINELFILPSPNQNPFQWIELYNPTANPVRMVKWTLTFRTRRTKITFRIINDSTTQFISFQQDTVDAPRDVPIVAGTNFVLQPYSFLTIVDNEERLKNYTAYGPGKGKVLESGPTLNATVENLIDSTITQSTYQLRYKTADQIILKDSTGAVKDVIRYGNYVYSGPGPDPFPNNQSLGVIVPYQSFARFAGAYTSGANNNAVAGNSATDFYVTGVQIPNTRPIPHWLSQAFKQ